MKHLEGVRRMHALQEEVRRKHGTAALAATLIGVLVLRFALNIQTV
jgi:hypothetical protein